MKRFLLTEPGHRWTKRRKASKGGLAKRRKNRREKWQGKISTRKRSGRCWGIRQSLRKEPGGGRAGACK